ncbi:MAG TPA: response regulator [Bryobacteraceae bacterium]|nr:response regulator [Bryobacteraceae bacterium]
MERADLEQWRAKDVARLLALVEGQRRYFQELIAALPAGVLVVSPVLDIVLANNSVRKIFNLPKQGPLKLNAGRLLPPWVLARVEQVLKTGAADTGIAVESGPGRRLQIGIVAIQAWEEGTGREALLTIEEFAASAGPSLRAEPVPVRVAAARPSVTELLEDVSAVLWAVDASNMRPILVSRQAEKLLGFPAEFWMSNPSFWTDRVHPADRERVLEFYQRAVKRGDESACEFRSVRADGEVIWLREAVRVVRDSSGRASYLAGVTLDVTERRMLEQQLVQEERIQAIQKLASRMAHDLNNMLMILEGNAEEVLNGLPAGSAVRDEVEAIVAAAQRITGLTGHLLAFARRAPAAVEAMEFEPALSPLVAKLGLERRGSLVRARVSANAARLEQAVTAIVSALRKPGESAPPVTIEASSVEIREDLKRHNGPLQPGEYVTIALSIPSGAAQDEFGAEVFERMLPGKAGTGDAGPELAQAYAAARQWGGDISMSAGLDEGTVFRIYLPRIGGAAGAEILIAPPGGGEKAPGQLSTILIVEDEAGIRALVQKFLRKYGYEVLEAANGEEALRMVQGSSDPVDLLITDMIMPQMGGRELVSRLSGQGRDLKILYISGYTDDSIVYAAELPPGSAFLQKPFTLSSLLEKVRALLGS